jgi:hypothetical protein
MIFAFWYGKITAEKPSRFYPEYEQEGYTCTYYIIQDGYTGAKYLMVKYKGNGLAICPLIEKK